MKNTLKTVVAFALSAVMMLSLAACSTGGKGAADFSAKSTTAATESVTEKTEDNATVANAGNGKKVYFAGPLFNQAEKDYNLTITKVLEDKGYEVFLP